MSSPRRRSGCSLAPVICRCTPGSRRGGEALRLLEEYKPGRQLQTNVEFYTALLLHGLGLDVSLFTPTFAISRVSGWIAHAFEQQRSSTGSSDLSPIHRPARPEMGAVIPTPGLTSRKLQRLLTNASANRKRARDVVNLRSGARPRILPGGGPHQTPRQGWLRRYAREAPLKLMFIPVLVTSLAGSAGLGASAQAIDLSRSRLVDLTHSYNAQTIYWPTAPTRFILRSWPMVLPPAATSTPRTASPPRSTGARIWTRPCTSRSVADRPTRCHSIS